MKKKDMTRFMTAVTVIIMITGTASCGGDGASGSMRKAAEVTGLADAPPLSALSADDCCDWSLGSPCTPETFRETVHAHLSELVHRPGSTLRTWGFTHDPASCRPYTTVTVPSFPGSEREVEASIEAFVTMKTDAVMSSMAPLFALPRATRSPVLECETKIGTTAPAGPGARTISFVSDGLQSTVIAGDWECLPLEPLATLVPRLAAARVLERSSLRGVELVFGFFDPTVIDHQRCPSVIGRALTVRDTHAQLARSAGARAVHFYPGVPVLGVATSSPKGGAD